MMDTISIVTVNYHCQHLICRCFDSLNALGRLDLLYIVVDNSEIPDTEQISMLFPETSILRPGRNLGFAGGCNVGIKQGLYLGASYILLLNPDTRTEHDFISPLLSALEESPKLGMVSPKIVCDSRKREIWSAGGDINWWIGRPSNVYDNRFSNMGKVVPVIFLSGCALLIRTEAIRQVGLMDHRYFLYFEDADYVQRFLRAGWQVAYVPEAEILHASSSTTGFQSEIYTYYFSRNRIWFMKRWALWYQYIFFMAFNTIVKLPGAVMVFGLIRRQPKLVAGFFRGFRDGLWSYSRNTDIQ